MSEKEKIQFYFDFISHNSWVAWTQIFPLAKKFDLEVEPVPVLFGVLLKAHNQLGPAEVPAKLKWMTRNVIRKAAKLDITVKAPASHPFNPLISLRACLIDLSPEKQRELIDRIFQAVWVEKKEASDPAVISQIFIDCGIDAEKAFLEIQSQKVKTKLRENTESAIEKGVFGVPTMIVREELFWGYDDFPYLEMFLKGEDPDMTQDLKDWANLKATARRKEDPRREKTTK